MKKWSPPSPVTENRANHAGASLVETDNRTENEESGISKRVEAARVA